MCSPRTRAQRVTGPPSKGRSAQPLEPGYSLAEVHEVAFGSFDFESFEELSARGARR